MTCYSEIPADQEIDNGASEIDAPFNFPPEGGYALFYFTNETFTKVLSALWNGAALTYPDEMYQVIWYFLENVEVPVSLCDQIAECISTSEGTRAAIRNMLATDSKTRTILEQINSIPTVGEVERQQNLLKEDECNSDYLFNQTSQLVFLLDLLASDVFEAVEVGTNAIERAEKLVAAIPVVGALPFDEIIGAADRIISEIQEAYTGAYDQALYDSIRCDLFCSVKDACVLTIEDAVGYYEGKLGEEIPHDPAGTLNALVEYLVTGSIAADAPVYAMHLFVLACIRTAQNVFGIDFATLALRIKAAGDDPDNDWTVLCEDCPDEPGERTPVIEGLWDPANVAGTLSGPDSEGVWTVTAGDRGTDQAFVIRDIDGRPFVIVDHVYSAGPSCQVWLLDETVNHLACGVGDQYVDEVVDEFWTTWAAGTLQSMQFKMAAPLP